MNSILITIIQFFASLSLLVLIHEFGHFITARLFKVRVEKFYLFFNPWFSLFKFKPKNSQTEYGVGWLPLGGYVKIAGMIDESMDKEQMALPPQPDEFRAKPAGQRLIIMLGGVIMNFLLALVIYAMILFTWGDKYVPTANMSLGMDFSPVAKEIGFQDKDILLSADGVPFERYDMDLLRTIAESKTVEVMRQGVKTSIAVPEDFMLRIASAEQGFASVRYPMVVDKVVKNSAAEKAGILAGDQVLSVGGKTTETFDDVTLALQQYKSQEVSIGLMRQGKEISLQITPDGNGKLGVQVKPYIEVFQAKDQTYTFIASIPAGVELAVNTLKGYVSDMKYVFTKEGVKSVGSFFTIGNLFPPVFNAEVFWNITAFLSIILAVMNVLPIPALDGGHALLLIYEEITRRKPSDKFLEYVQMAGMIFLFALMALALGNDIRRFFL